MKPRAPKPSKSNAVATALPPPGAAWAELTWSDLEHWAGSRSVARGRSYQRSQRVADLRMGTDGQLRAHVRGQQRYTTTVRLTRNGSDAALDSTCSCPMVKNCKHAVAVVAEYLAAIAAGTPVPRGDTVDGVEERDDDDNTTEHETSTPNAATESAEIERHIRSLPQNELAELVCSLIRTDPELYREFRERLALKSSDVKRLVAEARRELHRITSQPGWRNKWTGEGHTPDYASLRRRFERLLALGRADEVATLGRTYLTDGMHQVSQSDDEGETLSSFVETLAVVFAAVERSSLSGAERLLFLFEAEMLDDYGAFDTATAVLADAEYRREDWSAVANAIRARLSNLAAEDGKLNRDYHRSRISDWLANALTNAGREAEVRALYESEARTNGSYVRIVDWLLARKQSDDAARWAREGIAATTDTLPGITKQLADRLRTLAKSRRQWDVVAAHAACDFFVQPTKTALEELLTAAAKAGHEAAVRTAALRFLETGIAPYRIVAPQPKPPTRAMHAPRGKPTRALRPTATPPAPQPAYAARVEIDPTWPLPVPEELIPLHSRRGLFDHGPVPRFDVLLDMAFAAKQPAEVLRWYDAMSTTPRKPGMHYVASAYAERVAEAVAASHPERAIEIDLAALNAQLPHLGDRSYEASAAYLRKLRPLYDALGRAAEWKQLLDEIREKYRTRRRFVELLDSLDGRTIVESARASKR